MIAKLKKWLRPDIPQSRFVPARPMNSTYIDLYKFHYMQGEDVERAILATERVFAANEADQIRFFEQYRK